MTSSVDRSRRGFSWRAGTAALVSGLLAVTACSGSPERGEQGSAEVTPALREAFDAHYLGWRRFIEADPARSLSSDPAVLSSGPDYDAIVALGTPAIPLLLERMGDEGELFLNLAMGRITGQAPPPPEAGAPLPIHSENWKRDWWVSQWAPSNGY